MATTTTTARKNGKPTAAKRRRVAAAARRRASAPPAVPHLSVAERIARGRAARAEAPRTSHAAFEPASNRPSPITLLQRQARARVPELVPIRYGRMLVSPFTFYRGGGGSMGPDPAPHPPRGAHR